MSGSLADQNLVHIELLGNNGANIDRSLREKLRTCSTGMTLNGVMPTGS